MLSADEIVQCCGKSMKLTVRGFDKHAVISCIVMTQSSEFRGKHAECGAKVSIVFEH